MHFVMSCYLAWSCVLIFVRPRRCLSRGAQGFWACKDHATRNEECGFVYQPGCRCHQSRRRYVTCLHIDAISHCPPRSFVCETSKWACCGFLGTMTDYWSIATAQLVPAVARKCKDQTTPFAFPFRTKSPASCSQAAWSQNTLCSTTKGNRNRHSPLNNFVTWKSNFEQVSLHGRQPLSNAVAIHCVLLASF